MTTQAHLTTVCPFSIARDLDILEYPEDWYKCDDKHEIITSFGHCCVKQEYLDMCIYMGLEPYDVARQEVIVAPRIQLRWGELHDEFKETVNCVSRLICLGYRVWLRVDC